MSFKSTPRLILCDAPSAAAEAANILPLDDSWELKPQFCNNKIVPKPNFESPFSKDGVLWNKEVQYVANWLSLQDA
jgi:hypothetical protein